MMRLAMKRHFEARARHIDGLGLEADLDGPVVLKREKHTFEWLDELAGHAVDEEIVVVVDEADEVER